MEEDEEASTNELLCLKWTGSGIASVFSNNGHLERSNLCRPDVTLAVSNDDRCIRAHKLVLAAASDFLGQMLEDDSEVVVVPGVNIHVLQMAVDFMYAGQVWVSDDAIDQFMALSSRLRIKGLLGLMDETAESSQRLLVSRKRRGSPTTISSLAMKQGRYLDLNRLAKQKSLFHEKDLQRALEVPCHKVDMPIDEKSIRFLFKAKVNDDQGWEQYLTKKKRHFERARSKKRGSSESPKKDGRESGSHDKVEKGEDFNNGEKTPNVEKDFEVLEKTEFTEDDDDDEEYREMFSDSENENDDNEDGIRTRSGVTSSPSNRRSRLSLKDRSDPLKELSDESFLRRYRFDKRAFLKLVDLLHSHLGAHDQRGLPLSPIQQVAAALAHLGDAGYQKDLAADIGVNQTAVCRKVISVLGVLAEKCDHLIQMPSEAEMKVSAERFEEKYGLKNVAFSAQSFLVKLSKRPPDKTLPDAFFPEEFLIRDELKPNKQTYAQKVLLLVDADNTIRFVDSSIPGLRRDSEVWLSSPAKASIESQSYMVLGPRSFPLSSSFLVPFKSSEAASDLPKASFNAAVEFALSATSGQVINMLRRRFPALRRPARQFYPNNTLSFKAACVLYNFALKESKCDESIFDEDQEELEQLVVDMDEDYYDFDEDNCKEEQRAQIEEGRAKRDQVLSAMPDNCS